MITVDEITTLALALKETIIAMDEKLDEVKEYIETLGIPQAKLDALGEILDSGKTLAINVLAEADALDDISEPPEPTE